MTRFKRILILQTAFPGDIVLTTPFFRSIKTLFPDSLLTVITTPQGRELLQGIKEADSLLSYDKRGSDKGFYNFIKLIKKLRGEKFDLCLSPHLSLRTSLLLYLTASPVRIGYREAACSFLYSMTAERDMSKHEVDRILSLLGPLQADVDKLEKFPYLPVSEEARKKVDELLKEENLSEGDALVGIAPGSVWGTKRWTPGGYGKLVDSIVEKYGVKVMLIGSPAERESGNEIMAITKTKPVDMIGKTTLSQLGALMSRSSLLVGNDSAPGHVAAATGVPVVTIFGPTSPSFGYAPYGKNVQIVEKALSCRPCHHHGPMVCPKEHFRCMRDITVNDVMDAIERTGALT